MKTYDILIRVLSPLHLGSGQADVLVDAEAVRDRYGMPVFPGKRFKGLLYESALELAEICDGKWFTENDVKLLFAQGGSMQDSSMIRIGNFYVPEYESMCKGWNYLNQSYNGLFNHWDVWESYTVLRYHTAIDKNTGTALAGSLHNIRAVEEGTVFTGQIILLDDSSKNQEIIEKALRNLRFAGAKRQRGFGHILCEIVDAGKGSECR